MSFENNSSDLIPIRLVFSFMIVVFATLCGAFLGYAGVTYGFRWPGLVKSVVVGALLLGCVVYGMIRGDKDVKLLNSLPLGAQGVGLAHAGLIMLFVVVLSGLAIWILEGPPQASIPGPFG